MAAPSLLPSPLMMCIASLMFISLWTGSTSTCSETTRVRKPWHSLKEEDQLQFVEGFKTLRRNGILVVFLEAHQIANSNFKIHTTDQNFFWHSYWLWEMENSFRAIGPEFECFALPYWDVTNDEAAWSAMDPNTRTVDDLPIYNSHLGGEGNVDDNYCLEDALWSVGEYTTEFYCADDEVSPDCCLKRHHSSDDDDILPSRHHISSLIFTNKTYAIYDGFQNVVNDDHTDVHEFVASVKNHTHFNPYDGEQVVDPLFPIFHAFIEYIRLMREDCYDFDLLAREHIEKAIPYSYGSEMNMTLDFHMNFSILCDGTDGEAKRMCSDIDITPRLMYDVSPNTIFDIVYEVGDLWSDSDELQAMCADHLNSSWWRFTDSDTMETKESFLNSAWQSVPTHTVSMAAMAMVVIAMAVIALLTRCGVRMREKKLMNTEEATYGAI